MLLFEIKQIDSSAGTRGPKASYNEIVLLKPSGFSCVDIFEGELWFMSFSLSVGLHPLNELRTQLRVTMKRWRCLGEL